MCNVIHQHACSNSFSCHMLKFWSKMCVNKIILASNFHKVITRHTPQKDAPVVDRQPRWLETCVCKRKNEWFQFALQWVVESKLINQYLYFAVLQAKKIATFKFFLCTNEPRDICLVSYVKTLKQKNKNKPKQNSKETKRNSAYGSELL